MKTARTLYHLARADFLERVRRYSFLVTVAAAVYLGYAVIAGDVKLRFGEYRGLNNSPWVGLQMAMCGTLFVSLAGFYVVKNAVARDIQTRVGQILATTPIDKLDYLFGKALSNLAVMTVILIVLVVAAGAGQLWSGEDSHIQIWPLLAPFLFIALPALALVAALAVFFETFPGLRGGFGNVVYFFVWMILIVTGAETHSAFGDFMGFELLESRVMTSLYAWFPHYHGGLGIGVLEGLEKASPFLWHGFTWGIELVSIRLYWFGLALAVLLLSAVLFDRFDPSRGFFRARFPAEGPRRRRLRAFWRRPKVSDVPAEIAMNGAEARQATMPLSSLSPEALQFRAAPVILAELRLMLKRQRWWWYAVAAGLFIAGLANPALQGRRELLPWLWVWPILLWSAMGTREARHQTGELVFSAANSVRRQFPAAWFAGMIVAVLMGSGVALRLLLARDWSGLLGLAVGAVFIPSLALAMGTWSGSGKLFEAVYIIWWYIGPIHHDRNLDFMFTSPQSFSGNVLRFYLGAAIVLFAIAVLGRRRQIRA